MHGNTSHKDFLDDIERESSDGGSESLVGVHINTEGVAFLGEFIDGLLHTRDFIVKAL
jgi:hypothetical protein